MTPVPSDEVRFCPRCGKAMTETTGHFICPDIGCPCFITKDDNVTHFGGN